ncbi:MAG: nitroreductase family protein [Fusicatenibacter sp.]|nr:nitroreductase family protein [Fusicatenibacter sp.]
MIKVNQEVCVGCGACEKDCPGHAIRVKEKKAEAVRPCIQCGHCVAICPVGAIEIPEYEMEDVEPYDPAAFTLDPKTFLHAVKFRRSIRNFQEKPLEMEKLERILQVGRYTATAKNVQGNRFILVKDQLEEFKALVWKELPGIIERIETENEGAARTFRYFVKKHAQDPSCDSLFFNCTSFLVIASECSLDGGLAAANIENMAVAEGAGVLYSGYLQRIISASTVLRDWLETEGKEVGCCMLLGYPAVHYHRTAPRKKADIIWK